MSKLKFTQALTLSLAATTLAACAPWQPERPAYADWNAPR